MIPEDVEEYYNTNQDFKEYIDRVAVSQEKEVYQVLESAMAKIVKDYMEGGSNDRQIICSVNHTKET